MTAKNAQHRTRSGHYNHNSISTYKDHCVAWPRAYFIASHISPSVDPDLYAASMEMLLLTWSCHDHDLGHDVQLYDLLDKQSASACPAAFSGLTVDRVSDNLLTEAALIATLKEACPTQLSSQQLTTLDSRFGRDLTARINGEINIEARFVSPWPQFPEPQEDLPADLGAWRKPVYGIVKLFSKAGSNGRDVMWDELGRETLWNRIIFGQILLYQTDHGDRGAIRADNRKKVDVWVAQGLRSSDQRYRYAAVTAIANLRWTQYKKDLQRLMAQDSDSSVRWAADRALTYLAR